MAVVGINHLLYHEIVGVQLLHHFPSTTNLMTNSTLCVLINMRVNSIV